MYAPVPGEGRMAGNSPWIRAKSPKSQEHWQTICWENEDAVVRNYRVKGLGKGWEWKLRPWRVPPASTTPPYFRYTAIPSEATGWCVLHADGEPRIRAVRLSRMFRFRGFRLTQHCFNSCSLFYSNYPLHVLVVRPSSALLLRDAVASYINIYNPCIFALLLRDPVASHVHIYHTICPTSPRSSRESYVYNPCIFALLLRDPH
jgi:hypothetical protein